MLKILCQRLRKHKSLKLKRRKMLKCACVVQIYGLEAFQKACFEGYIFARWTFLFASPPASVKGVNLPHTHSCTHLTAAKVVAWCFTEQNMSLVVPVSSSHSCQADLRWQTCGLLSYPVRGVLCQMLWLHVYSDYLLLFFFNQQTLKIACGAVGLRGILLR